VAGREGPLVFGRVTATALPGPMKFFRFVGGGFFLDQQLEIASVVEARDQYGNIIPDVPIAVTAEPPFRVEGTKLSSSAETMSRVTVTSGEFSISQNFAALRNLTSLAGARGSWSCDGVGGIGQVHQSTTLVVDSVRYHPMLEVWMYFTATTVNTMQDQSTHSETWSGTLQATQVPRHLQWDFLPISGTAELTSESPVTYVGGDGCYGWNPSRPEQFTLIKD
jgi:hypothetical protein